MTASRPISRATTLATIAVLSLLVSGCASINGWWHNGLKVGPEYARPAAQTADHWIEADDPRVVSQGGDHCHWWTVFNDPVLNRLVQTAYDQNLPLRVAGLRVLEARAQLAIARGNLWPQQQQLFFDYQRNQLSKKVGNNALAQKNFSLWDLGFDAAWELDVWGRIRRSIEAADASLNANVETYDDVLVTLVSDVAITYVQIRTVQQQLLYAHQNVEIQKGSLSLAEIRFRNGATTELDVQQAKSNLASTEAVIPQLDAVLRQAENRLCILLGVPPLNVEYLIGPFQRIPTAPAEIAVGIPADLLRRRPDVRAAERRAAAQSALIGVATADLLPQFAITGFIGLQSNDFADLFSKGAWAGNIAAPAVGWNILNYGRIRNNIQVQDVRFQQLAVAYEETVLRANQEVENALVDFLRSQEQTEALARSTAAAERSVDLALTQYRDGAIDFNRVFSLEAFLVTQQDQLAAAQGDIARSLIRVYKALGGGWEIRLCPAPDSAIVEQPAASGSEIPMPDELRRPGLDEDVPPPEPMPLDPMPPGEPPLENSRRTSAGPVMVLPTAHHESIKAGAPAWNSNLSSQQSLQPAGTGVPVMSWSPPAPPMNPSVPAPAGAR